MSVEGRPLILVGAGGFGRETAEAVRAINAHEATQGRPPAWRLAGFMDDDPGLLGTTVGGLPILGATDRAGQFPDAQLVVCAGNARDIAAKRRIVERLALDDDRYATLVHPTASVCGSCRPGPGAVLLAGVVATADVAIGAHVALMPNVVLTHDDTVADYVTMGSGVRLAGGVRVSSGAYLGSGCLVREGLAVGAGALVGMGSVVLTDIPAGETWAGVPAQRLRGPAGP